MDKHKATPITRPSLPLDWITVEDEAEENREWLEGYLRTVWWLATERNRHE